MTKKEFIKYIENPALLNESTITVLQDVINDYPAFSLARMLYLRNLRNVNSYKFESELKKHAIFISDRKVLYTLLSESYEPVTEAEILPYNEVAVSDYFGTKNNQPETEFNFNIGRTFELVADDKEEIEDEKDETIDLIDRFIIENPTIRKTSKVLENTVTHEMSESDDVQDGLITGTLAGVYMTQGLYDEALEAYEKLSLKFPEKNSYFASQIEKIKELISKDL